MATGDQHHRPAGWTVVLPCQPARIAKGHPEGGYTAADEIFCCDCGDHLDLDYRESPPEPRLIRGPYPITDGIAAGEKHLGLDPQTEVACRPG